MVYELAENSSSTNENAFTTTYDLVMYDPENDYDVMNRTKQEYINNWTPFEYSVPVLARERVAVSESIINDVNYITFDDSNIISSVS